MGIDLAEHECHDASDMDGTWSCNKASEEFLLAWELAGLCMKDWRYMEVAFIARYIYLALVPATKII
jgi:hypothetical protein